MARPQKYKSTDERIKAHRAQQTMYGRKIWECDICGCKLQLGNKSNHFKSEKHAKNLVRGDDKCALKEVVQAACTTSDSL